MSAQALQKIKKDLESGDPQNAINDITTLLNSDTQNASLLLLQTQAYLKLGQCFEAAGWQEGAVRAMKFPKDEPLVPLIHKSGVDIANGLIQTARSNKERDAASQLKIRSLVALIDFLEKKEKWDIYMERLEELIMTYISLDLYADAEYIYFNKLFMNTKLPQEKRHQAVIAIFNFPSFYKPKTVITPALIKEVSDLAPGHPDNAKLYDVYLASFDKKPKFSFYEMRLEELPQFHQEVTGFLGLCGQIYQSLDLSSEIQVTQLLQKNLLRLFRYISLSSIVHEQHSVQWRDLVLLLKTLSETQSFKDLQGKETNTPLYTLVNVIIDSDSRVFRTQHSGTYINKLADSAAQERELKQLRDLVAKKHTPLANLTLCEHLFSSGKNFEVVLPAAVQGIQYLRDLRKNGFIQGTEWEVKLQIIRCRVLLSNKVNITAETKNIEFNSASQRLRELITAAANFSLINSELPVMIYESKLSSEGPKSAKAYLDDIESGQAGFAKGTLKEDWIKSQQAWITYSYLTEITQDKGEQAKILEGVVILLKEAQALNPENDEVLVRLGTVQFSHHETLCVPIKQALISWLQALKLNQIKPDRYYCLALYYYFSPEQDIPKAIKCLEKVMVIQPDLEDAGLLYFLILTENGNHQAAFDMLQKVQKQNPLLPYPYFYMGVRLQNLGDYSQARYMFEGAARYHQFYHANLQSERRNYPSLRNVINKVSPYSRELGIYNLNGAAIWLHLGECYIQLDKFPTAEKCVKQAMSDIHTYLSTKSGAQPVSTKLQINRGANGASLLSEIQDIIHPFAQAGFATEDLATYITSITHAFPTCDESLQLDLLETLLLSGRVEHRLKNYHQSLMFASIGLENLQIYSGEMKQEFTWELVQVTLESLLMLIDENLGGKADRKQLEKAKYIKALTQISERIGAHQEILEKNEKLQRNLAAAFKVIGEENNDQSFIKEAVVILQKLNASSNITHQSYKRELNLDLAKLYHLQSILFKDESNTAIKIKLIRGLIKENPSKGEYWVYHGIFQKDENVKLRSFYKALALEPKDQFALNNIVCLHLRQGNYRPALKVLNHLRDIESLNALVVAVMVLLHARVALESDQLTPKERKRYLEEAISIGELFLELEQEKLDQAEIKINEQKIERDPRVDIHQFLSTQMYYLVTMMQHEIGDSGLQIIEIKEVMEERLKQTDLTPQSKSLLQKLVFKQVIASQSSGDCQALIKLVESQANMGKLVELIQIMNSKEAKHIHKLLDELQTELFSHTSDTTALKILALQEVLIKTRQPANRLILEEIMPRDFKKIVDKLDSKIARDFVHQQMHLMYMKYPADPDRLLEYSEILEENRHDSLKQLGCFEYEKVFHLHLLNSIATPQSTIIFHRELKRVILRGIPNINKIFENLRVEKEYKDKSCYQELMKYPSKLSGHSQCLWKLIRQGEIDKALGMAKVISFKLSHGIITQFTREDEQRQEDYQTILESIVTKDTTLLKKVVSLSPSLVHLLNAYLSIITQAQTGQEKSGEQLAQEVLIPWLSQFSAFEEIAEEQFLIAYELLSTLFLKRGYLQSFNELMEKVLLLDDPRVLGDFFTTELKVFILLNVSANLNTLSKKVASNKLQIQLENLLKGITDSGQGYLTKRLNVRMFKAMMSLSLNKVEEAKKFLLGITEESYEKTIMEATLQFQSQEYKKYYLSCIQLVAQLKKDIGSVDQSERDRVEFLLGYAYYLKARAEITFMEARKQGITLKEDFSAEESKLFTAQHFKTKALRSLTKGSTLLKAWPEVKAFLDGLAAML